MDYENDVGATCLLREAVRSAYEHVLRRGCDLSTVNEPLAALRVAVAPSLDLHRSTAATLPTGPTAAVLKHLRCAFGHAARGLPGPAVVSMIAAAAATYRLGDDEVLEQRLQSAAQGCALVSSGVGGGWSAPWGVAGRTNRVWSSVTGKDKFVAE